MSTASVLITKSGGCTAGDLFVVVKWSKSPGQPGVRRFVEGKLKYEPNDGKSDV